MKRIINGVTYNTDTATQVARTEWADDEKTHKVGTLYQTKGGAFFVHTNTIETRWNADGRAEFVVEKHEFDPHTRDEAQAWILSGEIELLSDVFPEPPEPEADEAPASTTVYLRIPSILKQRIEAAARAANQSLNAWAIRCMENCSAPSQGIAPPPLMGTGGITGSRR